MRIEIRADSVLIWLSANDTRDWSYNRHRLLPASNGVWPCSQLRGKRVFAAFDSNGLYDIAINGRNSDCDANEFNAITCDFLALKLPESHPAYFVTVGQFKG